MRRPLIILLIFCVAVAAIFYLSVKLKERAPLPTPAKEIPVKVKEQAHPKKPAPEKPAPEKPVPEKPAARIAIVLDDWGYNTNNIELLDSIDIPLTLAVLPNLAYSYTIAYNQSKRDSREVIMHMPMQPESSTIPLEKNTLLTSMGRKGISDIFHTALKTVPQAKGVSNHMGSQATKDKRLMHAIMEELKLKNLYFLDSVASSETACEEEAKKAGVRFAKRDIFLDNTSDKDYISSQIDKLRKTALKNGYAVGIGHDRTLTLEVLKKMSEDPPGYVKFVLLSELVDSGVK